MATTTAVRKMYSSEKLAPRVTSSDFLEILHREFNAYKLSVRNEFAALKQKNADLANKVVELEAKQRKAEFQLRIMSFEKLYMLI